MSGPIEVEVLSNVPKELYIGGRWQPAADASEFPVVDPSTESILCKVADAQVSDAFCALDAADRAQASWSTSSPSERQRILYSAFERLHERIEDLALLMTLEMGKPLAESRNEVRYAADFFRWFAGEAVRIRGGYEMAPDGQSRSIITRTPVGPCLLVTPWNFPLAMGARKIAPALAAGCTVVVKPAEQTPLSMLALASILSDLGTPFGVVNVLPTSRPVEVVGALMSDARLKKLSFTGSTQVGKKLLAQAASGVLRTSMELGGNAPFIVLDDADLAAATDGAMIAKMRNGGEACTAVNRFIVHESVIAEFGRRISERMSAYVVGRGTEDKVTAGPLIDAATRDKVAELVADAVAGGAQLIGEVSAVPTSGYFCSPKTLVNVPRTARLLHEEIFGPVAALIPVSSDREAVDFANATEYGLAAYVYSRDQQRSLSIADRLQVGMVGINQGMVSNVAAPFGGVKSSGLGREGGAEGINEYLETKYYAVANTVQAARDDK